MVLMAALVFCLVLIYSRRIRKLSRRGGIFVRSKKQKSNFGFAFYNSTAVEDDALMDGSNNNLLLNNMLKSIEFTEDRLELGRVIGQGAYGVVVKAEAIGIEKSIKITTVAVKMLKDDADQDQRNSLISEIRMLLFLGKHLNIVNLLGIVTKKKLMAIVEYCRYGNMKNFLLANRLNFINMVNIENGDLEIVVDDVKVEASNSSKDSGFSIKTPLKTLDLLNFVFQIARGMQYIHSKKVRSTDRRVPLFEESKPSRFALSLSLSLESCCTWTWPPETFCWPTISL